MRKRKVNRKIKGILWKIFIAQTSLFALFIYFDWFISTDTEFMTQPSEKLIFYITLVEGIIIAWKFIKEQEKKEKQR
jgi:energy-coupling factor transporter transmembrane protein EcfT